ncbi:MAG: hypothetical protein LIO77_09660 [Rikenellaceae bacterium]|nr:hypothetical protein [Rikenellaceae bacterium]
MERSGDGSLSKPYQIVFLRDALEILSSDMPVFLLEEGVEDGRLYLRGGIVNEPGDRTVREAWFAFDLCCQKVEDLQELFFDDDGRPAKIRNEYDWAGWEQSN